MTQENYGRTANPERTTVQQGDKHDQDWSEVAEDVREAAEGRRDAHDDAHDRR